MSHYPTGDTHPLKVHLKDDMSANTQLEQPLPDIKVITHMDAITSSHSLHAFNQNKVRISTTSDTNLTLLFSTIENGIPKSRQDMTDALRIYHSFREHLSSMDGVILYKECIIIPPSLRQDGLTALHAAYHGISDMFARAESSVFWPWIMLNIILTCHGCNHCNCNAPSQPLSPPIPPPTSTPASYPFQCICRDYFHYGCYNYLVIVERYSKWPIVERAQEGAKDLIDCLKRCFTTFGIPDELSSDGGPEFVASVTRTSSSNMVYYTTWAQQPSQTATAEQK